MQKRVLTCLVCSCLFLGTREGEGDTRYSYWDGEMQPSYSVELGYVMDADAVTGRTYTESYLESDFQLFTLLDFFRGDLDLDLAADIVSPLRRAGTSVPSELMSLNLEMRWFWRFINNTGFEFQFDPGIYSELSGFSGDAFGFPFAGVGVWRSGPDFSAVAGVEIRPGFEQLWMPIAGVVWEPSPHLRLAAMIPESRLTYHWNAYWSFYGGWHWQNVTYAMDRDQWGRDEVTLESRRWFVGASRMLTEEQFIRFEVGHVSDRSIEFNGGSDTLSDKLDIDDSLFFQIGITGAF